ncbi:HAMP domain-containing sensor histidine kinase [Janibacter cremeus]|uniref:sensor histidine kinase n=1 Tax=Janibacter cremeus TaxID=1285192 RepID=UPI0023F6A7EB|nr:HAMP domain-containing sensor histidine kinase [Janibacter cremeus]WEV79670.1 HAMP domain-containing sensor histidine kinase [Janibacter cremeus]
MSYGALVRRLLLAVALGGAVVTALVLGVVFLVVADGQSVLGIDPQVWVVIAPALGAGLAALVALAVLRVIDGRRGRGLTFITHQIETIREGGGALPRTNVGLTDIDATTQAIARLAGELARQRALDRDFAADASHQLRTPLTALLMRLEEIAETDDLEVIRDEAAVAVTQVERLSGVVDTLRSRTQEGGEIPEISLDSVLAGLQREYQPAFTAAHRTMRVDGPPGLAVRCAPMDLAQILQSLIENSLAHGDGRVTITMRGSIGSVVVEVQDEGEGVPTTIAPHIFERSVTSSGSGLGLGLARQLAERNGGRLELVQAQPAVFTVFLSGPGRR